MIKMKITLTADHMTPVPFLLYGGIERIIDMLIKGVMDPRHEVTLLSHKESIVACKLIPYTGIYPRIKWDILRNMQEVGGILGKGFDLVNRFVCLTYLTILIPTSLPKILSYQWEPLVKKTDMS
jgi:hypothetical protein